MSKKIKLKVKDNNPVISNDNPVQKLMIIFSIVSVIFICFYIITVVVTKEKETTVAAESDAVTIQYKDILIGNMYEQKENEYFVLVTKKDDIDKPLYEAYESNYSNKTGALEFYYADLGNGFNKEYFAGKSNLTATSFKDIRFCCTTLLYIKDDKIVNYYEGKTNIITFLKTKIS